ncbi:MAG: hypothetical protein O7A63_07365, partial [Acidobacteria bacterium]|nr:hypothetical protein [Acidobacteriota bacterium]
MISGLAEHRLRRLPWVLAACLSLSPVTATFAQDRSEAPDREPGGMTREIIDTIEDFESQRDAKCYATATRLENFIFGTPLSEETRFLKIDLQKTIIDRVWRQASDRAAGRGAGQVTLNDVEAFLRQIVSYQKDDEENIRVDLPTQTLDLSARDFRHYSSIAYALRAILAVAQDQRWSGDEPPLQLDERAVDALRETLDVLTLAVLALADREARANNEAEITPFRFLGAWDRIVSSAGDPPASAAAPAPFDPQGARPFLTFKAIVDQKISSYEKYNRIDGGDRTELFLANVRRYYARYHVPPGGLTLPDGLGIEVERFLDRVLALAQESASARGGALIRAHDLNHALQAVTPHTIDDLEDVTFFPRLSREKSVVLDAFDLDSFRDFGMHWRLIRIMLDMDRVTLTMEPDPFAAELIAEGIAQYSVLLLRMAGRMARAEAGAPFVMGRHLRQAGKEILGLAEAHANTKEEVIPQTASIKSASRMRSDAAGVFMTEVTSESGITFQHRSSDWLNRFRRDLAKAPPTFTGGGVA